MEALDSIVTAVGDIILVFEEAQSNWHAEIMIEGHALRTLVGEIEAMVQEKTAASGRIDVPALAADLRECNDKLTQSTRNLERIAASAPGGVIPKSDYSKLHFEMKMILHHMIQQLRITDDVNVNSLLRICKRVFDCFVRMRNTDSASGVEHVARETETQLADMNTHAKARIAETTDMDLKRRMQAELENVNKGTPIAVAQCKALATGTCTAQERDVALAVVLRAMKNLIDAIEQSSAKIKEYELMFPLPEFTAKPPRDGPPNVGAELNRLQEAVMRRDEPASVDAANMVASEAKRQVAICQAVAEKAPVLSLQNAIQQNIDALNKAVPEVVRATKEVLARPNDAAAQRAFENSVSAARAANRRLDDLKKAESFPVENARAVEQALADIHRAVETGDNAAAAEAARRAAQRMQDQVSAGRAAAANMKDPALKSSTLTACNNLEKLIPEVVRATKEALERPQDAQAQQKLRQVTEAARKENAKIAENVVENELQKNREDLNKHLGEVYAAAASGDQDATKKALEKAQADIDRHVELGRELARQVRDPHLKQQIMDACDALEDHKATLDAQARDAAAHPGDAHRLGRLQGTIDEIKDSADRVTGQRKFALDPVSADPNRIPEQTLATGTALNDAIDRLWKAVLAGDRDAAEEALGHVLDHMTRQANHARLLADQTNNPALKEKLLRAADDMERLIPQVASAARDAIDNPGDAAKQAKLKQLLDETKSVNGAIMDGATEVKRANATPASILDGAEANAQGLSDALLRLKQALDAGDFAAAMRHLKEIMDRIQQQIKYGRELAGMTNDPALKEKLFGAVADLERLAPQVEEAVRDQIADPTNPAKKARTDQLLSEVDAASRVIGNAAGQIKAQQRARANPAQIHAMARTNATSLSDAIAKLKAAVDANDREAAMRHLAEVLARIHDQIGYGKELANMTDDPALKRKALDAVANLERLAPAIEAATRDALDHPNDPSKKKHLHDLLDQADKAGNAIAEVAEEVHRRKTAPPPKPEPVVQAPQQRERPSAYTADGKRDEVMAAAHSVEDSLAARRAARTAEQRSLNDIAAQIAIEMEKLSLAARASNKRDMIAAAKRITALISKVQSLADSIASKCSHPGLADELRGVSKVPANFAVQLKIVTAVKEAVSGDSSAAAQLVVCAKGLANSVIETVNSAESAALRCPRS